MPYRPQPSHAAEVIGLLSYPAWVVLLVMLLGATNDGLTWGYLVAAPLAFLTGLAIWAGERIFGGDR